MAGSDLYPIKFVAMKRKGLSTCKLFFEIPMLTNTEISQIAKIVAEEILKALNYQKLPVKWLTFEEAMAYSKVKSRTTFRKWIDEGEILANKKGGTWRVDRESIDDFLYRE